MEEETKKYKPYVRVANRMNVELSLNEQINKLAKNFGKLSLKNKRDAAKKPVNGNVNINGSVKVNKPKRASKKVAKGGKHSTKKRKTHHRHR